MATKKKYNYNGTLLNLALLGGAALLLKKRTSSLRGVGVGAIHSRDWIVRYIDHRLDVYDRLLPALLEDGDETKIAANAAVQSELHSILKNIYF